jgi:hypothetical protein
MRITESTWSPFQSPEVRDIRAHLTPAEKQRLVERAADFGRESARRSPFPFLLLAVSFFYSRPVGFVLLVAFVIYWFIFERQRIQDHLQQGREFLATTEFARERGYTPETLRLFAFPWSR